MRNLRIKPFIWVLVSSSIILWGIILVSTGTEITDILRAAKKIPFVITIENLLWFLFIAWGWKFKIFRNWLVPFPCLAGRWEGTVHSTWVDPATGKTEGPKRIALNIKQNFISISCVMYSEEMASESYLADFLLSSESGTKRLVYNYRSTPRASVRYRSALHEGTALLNIILRPSRLLRGEYWTTRKTTGEIELRFVSKKTRESFE